MANGHNFFKVGVFAIDVAAKKFCGILKIRIQLFKLIMSNINCADRFVFNLIASGLVACWTVMAVSYFSVDVAWLNRAGRRQLLAVSIGAAACVLFVAPLLHRYFRHTPRFIFDDRESGVAVWCGRLIGMSIGIAAGIVMEN